MLSSVCQSNFYIPLGFCVRAADTGRGWGSGQAVAKAVAKAVCSMSPARRETPKIGKRQEAKPQCVVYKHNQT